MPNQYVTCIKPKSFPPCYKLPDLIVGQKYKVISKWHNIYRIELGESKMLVEDKYFKEV
jgi:hypothetical protein